MKPMTRRILTVALAVCAALPLLAQGGPGGPGGPGGGRGNRVEFLAGYLSLTAEQKTTATAIFADADKAVSSFSGQLKSANDALRDAIKAGQTDAQLETLAATIGTLHGQTTSIQAKAQSKFYALLTAEQKAKYDEMGGPGIGAGPRGMQGRGPRAQ
jgi:Spy/CpxP family protein refolding chaperone